ncbi:hypothetical protein [Entomospira culicis]|uniref:Uncharacterized protein n=1 Tax=Entomospira culicis TaxID=2719989 RepID=A0A968KUN4_9SPIO|nr:hypothetical protein [Entomospira culicis]NIZ19091.1 hypothetical protein [Entomospira culicis]NIZ69305.1 hypothetical protein [Entomospira culicis]WDI37891.1 hypothetical protein PVA46_03640 [Entomospira culicis]WDI39518.1 hypothetical protein PVA47_03640 [Entomospira culicis]
MYAISFDFKTKCLKENYGKIPSVQSLIEPEVLTVFGEEPLEPDVQRAYTGAYNAIRTYLNSKGFQRIQGSVYVYKGTDEIEQYTVYRYLLRFARQNPWFVACTKDLRIFKIEEYSRENVMNDLKEDLE